MVGRPSCCFFLLTERVDRPFCRSTSYKLREYHDLRTRELRRCAPVAEIHRFRRPPPAHANKTSFWAPHLCLFSDDCIARMRSGKQSGGPSPFDPLDGFVAQKLLSMTALSGRSGLLRRSVRLLTPPPPARKTSRSPRASPPADRYAASAGSLGRIMAATGAGERASIARICASVPYWSSAPWIKSAGIRQRSTDPSIFQALNSGSSQASFQPRKAQSTSR